MRKETALAIIGLFIIFCGIIVYFQGSKPVYSSSYEGKIAKQIAYTKENKTYSKSWSLEANLTEGEYVGFDFRPSTDWSLPPFENKADLPTIVRNLYNMGYQVKRLEINVTDPQKKSSTYFIVYLAIKPYMGAGEIRIFTDYLEVSHNSGAIIVEDDYPKATTINVKSIKWPTILLGRTSTSGNFQFNFLLDYVIMDAVKEGDKTKPWPHDPSLPPYVWIFGVREVKLIDYPYAYLTYTGLAISASGIAMVAYGAIKPMSKKRNMHKAHKRITLKGY